MAEGLDQRDDLQPEFFAELDEVSDLLESVVSAMGGQLEPEKGERLLK